MDMQIEWFKETLGHRMTLTFRIEEPKEREKTKVGSFEAGTASKLSNPQVQEE